MRFAMIFATLFVFACQSKKQELSDVKIDELRTNFSELLRETDSTMKLDSFRFIRLDTLTLKHKYSEEIDDIIYRMKEINYEFELLVSKYKTNLQLASLANGLSYSLYNNYKSDADDNKMEIEKYQEEMKILSRESDSLESLYDNCDSTTAICYQAICLYQFRRKDQSVKKDTTFIILNLDKNIIKREEFLKTN